MKNDRFFACASGAFQEHFSVEVAAGLVCFSVLQRIFYDFGCEAGLEQQVFDVFFDVFVERNFRVRDWRHGGGAFGQIHVLDAGSLQFLRFFLIVFVIRGQLVDADVDVCNRWIFDQAVQP
jgi:hypothetical protein